MSLHVMQAVWESLRPLDTMTTIVLVRLAGFADDDGGKVFPSVKRIATECRLSPRKVQYILRDLEASGLLVKVADEDPGRRRGREYRFDLNALASIPEGCTTCRGARHAGVHVVRPKDARRAGVGVHVVHPERSIDPSGKGQVISPDLLGSNGIVIALPAKATVPTKLAKPSFPEEAFAEFWTVYPRHVDEDAARGAFREALKKGATPVGLIASASAYAAVVVQDETPTRFIKKPANFLRHGAWKDAPEQPSPHRPNGTRRQSVQDAADLVFADTPEAQRFREAFR